jgi:hypothetical protein
MLIERKQPISQHHSEILYKTVEKQNKEEIILGMGNLDLPKIPS